MWFSRQPRSSRFRSFQNAHCGLSIVQPRTSLMSIVAPELKTDQPSPPG